jgi:eukaryotic-like serine/threonine-protein kinase
MTDGHTARLESALAGRYKIERKLGEGGMATVYLAEDLKHERKVAIKILRPELAAVIGAERFLAEIKTTANLQHPHILPLFDSGEADSFLYYVMPFIDGDNLRERIEKEGQLGVDEAVRIAREVADALDYAHRNDIIHRDIKPANILLHDGRPMVADFGIALAISAAGGGRMTETGLSLGTPHYMSPEQASADRDLSARSDVYSLGCVLYEMLAGQPPHTGPSAQSILVRILTEDPRPITDLRRSVPSHVAATVTKSIEKLPADRFESAKQFIEALDDPAFTYAPAPRAPHTTAAASAPVAATGAASGRGVPVWFVAAIGVVMLGAGLLVGEATMPDPMPEPSAQFRVLPDSSHLIVAPCCGRAVAVSPDGRRIVYQGSDGSGVRLYQRPLDQRTPQPVPGTEGGRHPFFSPDGEWLGFFSGGSLLKVRFDGGTPLTVTTGLGTNAGAAWSPDNTIVLGIREEGGLYRVSADGGTPVRITTLDTTAHESAHRWPHVLPDGETVLFAAMIEEEGTTLHDMLAVVPIEGGAHRLIGDGADPRYVEPGFVTFSDQAGSIMAQPFDARALELTGSRFRIAERTTWRGPAAGLTEYDISRNGTLVYRGGTTQDGEQRDLVLVSMDGSTDVVTTRGPIRYPRFSPDGRYIAFEAEANGSSQENDDVWVWDLVRGIPNRVTFENDNSYPAWSPDGTRLFFENLDGIYARRADGSGETELLQDASGTKPIHVSPDGRWLVWTQRGDGSWDVWMRRLEGDDAARPLLATSFNETSPAVSPDGRWIAYTSDESGDDEIYVEPFPDRGPKYKVTSGGASAPVWSPDGAQLYYRRENPPAGDLEVVDVRPGERFDVTPPRVLFSTSAFRWGASRNYDLSPDGTRFAFIRSKGEGVTSELGATVVVITNALNPGLEGR